MGIDVEAIKRKLLIKYPTFGSTIANLEFQEDSRISTLRNRWKKDFL